jgi:hypothetical protein
VLARVEVFLIAKPLRSAMSRTRQGW